MIHSARHWHPRELRFVGLLVLTGAAIALQLGGGLRSAASEGAGWRRIDTEAVQQRIERGDLRDHEAAWYHSATSEETKHVRGNP
jgi:hypothetical protein